MKPKVPVPIFGVPKSQGVDKSTRVGPGAYDVRGSYPTGISIGRCEPREIVNFNPAPGMYNVDRADKVVKYRAPEVLISPARSRKRLGYGESQHSPGPGEH